ncbi:MULTISPECIES: glycosyltransferase family 2 protein [unclassified Spirillospora]|uniref:glycosyltransferase family 2 protein n=1 Tax=unclassified Spirillospora TaxID=2642701 RepID=UPI00371CE2DF
MTEHLVSVIVPVYNCRETVGRTLESAFAQTLPADQVEIIAVDDGSTDGSAELLDELARAHDRLVVIHQPNSGGAGAPRNRGLDRASGRFVFFLDADDRLGPEALARMTEMAERNGTDIVLGKQVGTGGRKVPKVFDRTIERTHVLDPDCDLFPRMSMAALQLFRRSLIERAGLRFTEGLLSHEDQLFTAGAYLNAGGVSVLADYDCYYWDARADGTSSTQVGGAPTADVHAIAAQAMALVAEHTEPGEIRERLHHRYLQLEVFGRLELLFLDSSDDERKVTLAGCRELLDTWLTPGLLARYNPLRRVLAHCLQHDLDAELEELLRFHRSGQRPRVLLEDARAFARYPFFRDEATGIPDTCFETSPVLQPALTGAAWDRSGLVVSGTVVVRGVDEGRPTVHLVLENGEGARRRFQCATGPGGPDDDGRATTFTATVPPVPASWADGRWTMSMEAVLEGHILTAPLTKPRGMAVPHAVLVEAEGRWRLVRPLPPRGRGPFTVEVGGALAPTDLRNVEVRWGPGRRLRVLGEPPPVLGPGPAPSMSVLLGPLGPPGGGGDAGTVLRAPLVTDPDRRTHHRADVALTGARPGRWRASFEIEGLGEPTQIRLPDGSGVLGPVTASILPPRRMYVRLDKKPLTVHVTVPLSARLRRVRRSLGARSGAAPETEQHVKKGRE